MTFALLVAVLAVAPAALAAPHVAVLPSSTIFYGGEAAAIGFELINPPDGVNAEFYFGFIHPDGASVFTVSPVGDLLGPVGPLSQAVATRLARPGFSESTPTLVGVTVPLLPTSGIPVGTYLYFALLVRAGSLQDNTLDEADILAVDLKPILYTPILRSPNPTDPFLLATASTAGTTVELFGEKDPTGLPTSLRELRTTDLHGAIGIHQFDAAARLVRLLSQSGLLELAWQSSTHAQAHLTSLDGTEAVTVPIEVPAAAAAPAGARGIGQAEALPAGAGPTVVLTRDAARCGTPVPVGDAQLVLVLYDTGARSRWYVSGAPTGNLYPTPLPALSRVGAAVADTCHNTLALTSLACPAALAAAVAACNAAGPLTALPRLQEFCAVVARNDPGVCDALTAALAPNDGGPSACQVASQVDDIAGEAAKTTVTLTPVAVVDGALLIGSPTGGVNPAGPLPDLPLAVTTDLDCPVPDPADTTPPDTTILSGPSGTSAVANVTFTWTGSDDVTPSSELVYSYQLVGFDPSPTAFGPEKTKNYSGLTNGATYTFNVQARDAAGNVDPSAATRPFTVSIPAPDQHYVDGDVTFDVTSTDGCQRIEGQQGSVDFVFPGGKNAGATAQITQTLVLSTAPGASCTDARNLTVSGTQSAALNVSGDTVSIAAGPVAFSGTKTATAITGNATINVALDNRTFPPAIIGITAPLQ